jgi:hypothetical protein
MAGSVELDAALFFLMAFFGDLLRTLVSGKRTGHLAHLWHNRLTSMPDGEPDDLDIHRSFSINV